MHLLVTPERLLITNPWTKPFDNLDISPDSKVNSARPIPFGAPSAALFVRKGKGMDDEVQAILNADTVTVDELQARIEDRSRAIRELTDLVNRTTPGPIPAGSHRLPAG